MYTNEKEKQVEEFKENSTVLGRFILDKGANPKINFSENKTKKFWGRVLRRGVANWAVSWLTPKEQGLYTQIYDEKPWVPAVQGSIYNLTVTGYPVFQGMDIFPGEGGAILGSVYGLYLVQNLSRTALSILDNKSYPPPALLTLGINSMTYLKRFRENYSGIIEGLSSSAQAQGIITPLTIPREDFSGIDKKDNKNMRESSLEEKTRVF